MQRDDRHASVALRMVASLKHSLVDGDTVMRRMAPVLKERRAAAKASEKTTV